MLCYCLLHKKLAAQEKGGIILMASCKLDVMIDGRLGRSKSEEDYTLMQMRHLSEDERLILP